MHKNQPTVQMGNSHTPSTCGFVEDFDLAFRKVQGNLTFCPPTRLAARKLEVLAILSRLICLSVCICLAARPRPSRAPPAPSLPARSPRTHQNRRPTPSRSEPAVVVSGGQSRWPRALDATLRAPRARSSAVSVRQRSFALVRAASLGRLPYICASSSPRQ